VRSDLFSLGAVVYEMCTGQPAFPGDGNQVLDALLHRHPVAISRLNYDAPEELDRIVRKLLAKNPADRYQSARDLIVDLRSLRRSIEQEEYAELSPVPAVAVGKWARPALRRRGSWILLAVAAIAAAVTVWLAWPAKTLSVRPSPYSPMVLSIEAPPGTRFSEGSRNTAAISPDGQYVAFVATDSAGNSQLWLRPLRSPQAQVVADSRGAGSPFWSPDSRAIAFFNESGLRRVNLGGVRSEMMAPATEDRGGSWGASGVVLVALDPRRGLFQIPATGGRLQQVIEPDASRGEVGYMWPQFLHDGRRFIYFVLSNDERVRGIYLGSLDGGRGRRLVGSDSSAVSTAAQLLLVRDGTLVAQRFDESAGQLEGQPTPLLENVATSLTYRSAVSVSEVDSLVYSSGQATDVTQIGWYDRSGTRVATIDAPAKYRDPALSRDGRYLAVEHYRDSISDIRVFDLIRGGMIQFAPAVEVRFPVWSPAGRLAYSSSNRGWRDIYVRRMEGTGEPTLLVQSPSDKMPTDWSSDGRFLAYADLPPGGSYDLWVVPAEAGAKPAPILRGPAQEVSGKFSPDVKWLAYASDESGLLEVYVRRFPAGETARRASVGGGYDPVWISPKRLSFLDRTGQLMEVEVPASESDIIGRPMPVMRTKVLTPGTSRNHYQWSADGKRILVNSPAFDVPSGGMNVIVSWSSMLAK
jgi:Tol biopolymer transport system component